MLLDMIRPTPYSKLLIASGLALFGKVIGRLNPDMTDLMLLALGTLPPNRQKITLCARNPSLRPSPLSKVDIAAET